MVCPNCAVPLPADGTFCPGCGCDVPPQRANGKVGGISERFAGALAYTLLAAIAFLLLEPYKKNAFVRFHSYQSIGFCLELIVLTAGLRIIGVFIFFLPLFGHLVIFLLSIVVVLGSAIVWLVLVVKALQGEMFKLPLVGGYAELQAAK